MTLNHPIWQAVWATGWGPVEYASADTKEEAISKCRARARRDEYGWLHCPSIYSADDCEETYDSHFGWQHTPKFGAQPSVSVFNREDKSNA